MIEIDKYKGLNPTLHSIIHFMEHKKYYNKSELARDCGITLHTLYRYLKQAESFLGISVIIDIKNKEDNPIIDTIQHTQGEVFFEKYYNYLFDDQKKDIIDTVDSLIESEIPHLFKSIEGFIKENTEPGSNKFPAISPFSSWFYSQREWKYKD